MISFPYLAAILDYFVKHQRAGKSGIEGKQERVG